VCTFRCSAKVITVTTPKGLEEQCVQVDIASPSEIRCLLPRKAWENLTEGEREAWVKLLGEMVEAHHGLSAHLSTVKKWCLDLRRYSLGRGGA